MIAGLLDAMRADVSPSIRIVWQCLENHANGARWWRMTEAAIADEVHLSLKTVERAVLALQGKGDGKDVVPVLPAVLRVVRHKRRAPTFTMLRTYPEGCPKPRHEPEVAARFAPDLTRQNDGPTAELTRQNDESLNPPEKNPPEKEERARADARAPSTSSSGEILVAGKSTTPPRQHRKTPLPDDWAPSAEERQMALAAGFDPAEIVEEMADWARETEARSADWAASFRRWVRRERKFTGQRRQSPRPRTAADAIAERYFGRGRAGA